MSQETARRQACPVVGHRDVIAIALPIMLSNATMPLVGLVDTIVVGQTGAPHVIGGVAAALAWNGTAFGA